MKKHSLTKLIITGLISVSLVGCQLTRTNAITGEEEMNDTTAGFLLGCAGGALAGALINKGKGAAIGCAAGGGAGAAVGYQMDKQEDMLRSELRGTGVQIKRDADQIKLILAGDITFSTGSVRVDRQILPSLKSIAKVMKEFDDTELLIVGYTDTVGSRSSNESLSLMRAKSVQQELNKVGLPRSRTYADGIGELMPRCSNDTKQGRACNRRVELTIMPMG